MAKIKHLNEHLTNMIAAGEVVERPSGIVKELVENSIDAAATEIEVILKEGGIQSIQVIDNGVGMDAKDASLAFDRHATSKISEVNDLWSIATLGFRGEALPSIASVSRVILLTNNGVESTRIEMNYGKVESAKPFASNQGTDITVEGLFLKTPARLKHLKSIPYEAALITSVMEKFAMSYPMISFRLVSDGREVLRTNGKGNLTDIVYAIYGKETARNAVPFSGSDYDYTVSGLLVLPVINRANRNYITLFINGRMIRSYRLSKVIVEAYQPYLPSDRYPMAIVTITMDPKLVDVNVHPSKWEIRLSKENQLEQLVKKVIVDQLAQSMQAPEIEIRKPILEPKVIVQSFDLEPSVIKLVERNVEKEVVSSFSEPIINEQPIGQTVQEKQAEYHTEKTSEPIVTEQREFVSPALPTMQLVGQYHGKYILAENEEGLFIIDQHAAQERYRYELYDQRMNEQSTDYYELLVPVMIEIGNSNLQRLEEIRESFLSIGITVEQFGTNSIVCRSVPIWMEQVDMQDLMQRMVDYIIEEKDISLSALRKHAVATMACHSSIRFNRVLNREEMQQVIDDLKKCKQPFQCPHGRPTFIKLTDKQLEREFLR